MSWISLHFHLCKKGIVHWFLKFPNPVCKVQSHKNLLRRVRDPLEQGQSADCRGKKELPRQAPLLEQEAENIAHCVLSMRTTVDATVADKR